jgi:hypothetical protein
MCIKITSREIIFYGNVLSRKLKQTEKIMSRFYDYLEDAFEYTILTSDTTDWMDGYVVDYGETWIVEKGTIGLHYYDGSGGAHVEFVTLFKEGTVHHQYRGRTKFLLEKGSIVHRLALKFDIAKARRPKYSEPAIEIESLRTHFPAQKVLDDGGAHLIK